MSLQTHADEKSYNIGNTSFTLQRKYADLKIIGKGSYGVVCSALDTKTGTRIAIKKITPMAKHSTDAKHVLREIRLMKHMGKHENIISLEDIYVRAAADELYIIMELLDSDLHRILQSDQALSESHFKYFMHQLICGVKYLHSNRIIHRDLKVYFNEFIVLTRFFNKYYYSLEIC
jgi:serine/threonine protein kinase